MTMTSSTDDDGDDRDREEKNDGGDGIEEGGDGGALPQQAGEEEEEEIIAGGGGRAEAAAEGYTPLDDLVSSTAMLSFGPDGAGADGGGAFYADISAFRRFVDSDDSDSEDGEGAGFGDDNRNCYHRREEKTDTGEELLYYGQLNAEYATRGEGEEGGDDGDDDVLGGVVDFRSVADGALAALEGEYRSTLVRGGGAFADAVAATAAAASRSSAVNDGLVGDEETLDLPPIRLPAEDFGSDFFVTNFDDPPTEEQLYAAAAADERRRRPLPDIDADAVRKAVQAIHRNDPKLERNYSEWRVSQVEALVKAPQLHPIVPKISLKAFRRYEKSAKAAEATAVLTRAATIAEALQRQDLLQGQFQKESTGDGNDNGAFQIDVVGCDKVECESEERIRRLFGPLVKWIGRYPESPRRLRIRLIGPNVPRSAPTAAEPLVFPDGDLGRLDSAHLVCVSAAYGEGADAAAAFASADVTPNIIVSFNAGIWGYDEWRPTLRYLAQRRKGVPFVVTAYTLQEAQDDADVIQEELNRVWLGDESDGLAEAPVTATAAEGENNNEDAVRTACIWDPEFNAFASRVERQTATAVPGRRYRENAAWQAWRI